MVGCQYYGPLLGTLDIGGRIIIGIQKGTIILTTTHIKNHVLAAWWRRRWWVLVARKLEVTVVGLWLS